MMIDPLNRGESYEEAYGKVLAHVISSPKFLYLLESPREGESGEAFGEGGRVLVDDYALATRLSYFLWSSMPDEELFKRAAAGDLHEPKVLRKQVERMLKSPKSEALVARFTDQWLDLGTLPTRTPDVTLFPSFDEHLRRSMVTETRKFFREILDKDHGVQTILDADFTYLNNRMAVHYGMKGVNGDAFRRVKLAKNDIRRGVLGQASVLTATSMDQRTAPVIRGAFTLTRLLGEEPPIPPANVPDLDEIPSLIDGKPVTGGQKLRLHREDPACKACHLRIDPMGLALEQFDAVGRWQEAAVVWDDDGNMKVGEKIQVADVFPTTREKFETVEEYKDILNRYAKKDDRLARAVCEHLCMYSLGRKMTFSDRAEIQSIVDESGKNKHGLRSMVHALVQSELFQSK